MRVSKQVLGQYEGLSVLKNLTKSYSEISANRMQMTRKKVLINRGFSVGISSLFRQIIYSYPALREGKDRNGLTFLSNNGMTVAVLLSANTGLYGDVVRDTFDFFSSEVKNNDLEVTIIGKLGRAFYLQAFPNRPYTYFELPDWGSDSEVFGNLVAHLVQYRKVEVFYEKFESIVKQVPDKFDIEREVELSESEEKEAVRYIFEPNLSEVMKFFEGEIFGSSLAHVLQESQLAKLASRAFAMDRAEQTTEKRIRKVKLEILRSIHRERNRKQLNVMSGVLVR